MASSLESIDKYELRAVLGRGSYGTVYLGFQRDLDRPVAIKELLPHLSGDPVYLDHFRAEARVMASINSIHCVRVYDFLEVEGRALLVSEFVDGASLQAVVEKAGRLSAEQALAVLKGALSGLADANRHGLVHRDVKPANLLADREGVSKLADFGQAYPAGLADSAGPGASGTPAYMSPEQVRGVTVDHRSDIYSCGAVLFELLTGQPPFRAERADAVMRMHLEQAPPDPRRLERTLPRAVARLAQRAMAKDPAERPGDALELLSELETAAAAGYGVGWEERGSIRLLVGAAAVAGAATIGAVGASAAATPTGGVTVGSATVGTPTPPPPAPVKAGGQLGRLLRGPTGIGAAATVGLLLAATLIGALTHSGPFAPPAAALPTAFVAAFGTGGAAHPAAASAGGETVFSKGPAGSIVERTTFAMPQTVALGFAYCDALVCGNSDNIGCIGNSYVPQFASALPLTVRVGSPGGRLEQAVVAAGQAPGAAVAMATYGSGSAPGFLAGAPSTGADGSLVVNLATPWRKALEPHFDATLHRYCGFSPEQRKSFGASYGSSYRNPYPVLTVLSRWAAPGGVAGNVASLEVNGVSRQVPVVLAAEQHHENAPPVFTQGDPRWAGTRAGKTTLGRDGTVPTAVASVLSASGNSITPGRAAEELVRARAWDPDRGTDWPSLVAYLNTRAVAGEIDLATAAQRAEVGGLSLVALTDGGAETMAVLEGYDPVTDRFTAIDPRQGQVGWSWDMIAAGNPWFVSVDRGPAP